jgi:hypothetical protein
MDSSAMLELRILAEQTGADCCSAVEPIVAHGNPSIEILALAHERHASLIVLGATRRSAFEEPHARPHRLPRARPRALPGAHVARTADHASGDSRPRRQRPSLATGGGSPVLGRARLKPCLFNAASF